MISYLLQIEVKPGCVEDAVEALSTIEAASQADDGMVEFVWLQHTDDPLRFTLYEQWANQASLDAHLAQDPSVWNRFVPCLAAEPRSYPVRPVRDLARPPAQAEVDHFATLWFDGLSKRAPVEDLLRMLTETGLDMRFPDATLTDEVEFREWYAAVGKLFADQTHVIEALDVTPVDGSRASDVDVTVVWRTREVATGQLLAFRARQRWRLERSLTTGQPVIVRYEVSSLEPVADAG